MNFTVGTAGHFGLAVDDPERSATWFAENLGFRREFDFDGGVVIGNDAVTITLERGRPSPVTIDHVSFHFGTMNELESALEYLKANGVAVEDPGHEIGPEGSGSENMGLRFHDPDGYRWEFSVLHGGE